MNMSDTGWLDFKTGCPIKSQEEIIKDLQQKLLQSQASEARSRELLKEVLLYLDTSAYTHLQIDKEIRDALSTPPNTAELDAYVESEIDKRLGEPVAWSWDNDGVIEYSIDVYAKEYYEKHYGVVMTPLYAKKG